MVGREHRGFRQGRMAGGREKTQGKYRTWRVLMSLMQLTSIQNAIVGVPQNAIRFLPLCA